MPEQSLLQWLQTHFVSDPDPETSARAFIRDVREHSGLLLDRGGRRFGFMHLTFMEYLAGVWLAKQSQRPNGVAFIADTVRRYAGESEWREVLLLAIGYMGLKQEQEIITTQLLKQLLQPSASIGTVEVIAAAALADIGEDGVTPEGWLSLRQQLLKEGVRNPLLQARYRVSIGQSMAVMGDPRKELMAVDAMRFCWVPAGVFWMGKGMVDEKAETLMSEIPAGEYDLHYDYWLAQYPVTVAQYGQFVDEGEAQPDDENRLQGSLNDPVVDVSWHEAMAFCQWLTRRWRSEGGLSQDWCVTLPNEPEWEKAARGGLRVPKEPIVKTVSGVTGDIRSDLQENLLPQGRYPWGNEIDDECLNYGFNIGRVSTPGAYPGGQSVYGCEDLSGNVWEWTRSKEENYPYPQSGTDQWRQREAGEGNARRVLRGGAFRYDQGDVRAAVRHDCPPNSRYSRIGFRVCLSPFL